MDEVTFDPKLAFIECPKCDSAFHVERIKGAQWFCNCCAHEFEGPQSSGETGTTRRSSAPRGKLLAAVAALFVAVSVDASAQGRVFYEPGDGSSKATTDCPPTTTARDGVPHRSGMALECNWDGTKPWYDSDKTRELELDSVPMKSERLVSAWFRVDADVDATVGSKMMRLGFGSANDLFLACQFEQGAGATMLVGFTNQPTYWGGVAAAQCRNGWTRLRVYTSPSLVRLWLNEALVREWTGAFSISSMTAFMSNWSDNPGWSHDANNHLYWQAVEIFTDAGTGGVGSMRDGTMTQGGTTPPPPPPAPVDCAGTWGSWTRNADSDSACSATGTRTFTESRLFTVSRTPANGGAACPASPETRTVTENCAPPVQSVTYTCWVTSSPAGYADGDVRRYMRCDTNGPVASLPNGTTFTVTVPKK